jgi:hypothetical protein
VGCYNKKSAAAQLSPLLRPRLLPRLLFPRQSLLLRQRLLPRRSLPTPPRKLPPRRSKRRTLGWDYVLEGKNPLLKIYSGLVTSHEDSVSVDEPAGGFSQLVSGIRQKMDLAEGLQSPRRSSRSLIPSHYCCACFFVCSLSKTSRLLRHLQWLRLTYQGPEAKKEAVRSCLLLDCLLHPTGLVIYGGSKLCSLSFVSYTNHQQRFQEE